MSQSEVATNYSCMLIDFIIPYTNETGNLFMSKMIDKFKCGNISFDFYCAEDLLGCFCCWDGYTAGVTSISYWSAMSEGFSDFWRPGKVFDSVDIDSEFDWAMY